MRTPPPKHQLYELFARVAKAMASASRLELLEALGQGARSVDSLGRVSGMNIAKTSHHLQVLKESGLVDSQKVGLQVIYRLADGAIPAVLAGIRGIAERRLAEVEKIVRENFHVRDRQDPLGRDEVLERSRKGEVTLIDVRPASEFAAGHIPGALNVPLHNLPDGLKRLSGVQEFVIYCRGPYSILAFEAVSILREHGFKARRLQGGFPEWQSEDRPVERSL